MQPNLYNHCIFAHLLSNYQSVILAGANWEQSLWQLTVNNCHRKQQSENSLRSQPSENIHLRTVATTVIWGLVSDGCSQMAGANWEQSQHTAIWVQSQYSHLRIVTAHSNLRTVAILLNLATGVWVQLQLQPSERSCNYSNLKTILR